MRRIRARSHRSSPSCVESRRDGSIAGPTIYIATRIAGESGELQTESALTPEAIEEQRINWAVYWLRIIGLGRIILSFCSMTLFHDLSHLLPGETAASLNPVDS